MVDTVGRITKMSCSVAVAEGPRTAKMHGVVLVGDRQVRAEVVKIDRDDITLCFLDAAEEISVGDRVVSCDIPFTAELGPGLLGHVFDALQRPIFCGNKKGTDIFRSAILRHSLDQSRLWHFEAALKFGDKINGGDVYGTVRENGLIIHKITVPYGVSGSIVELRSGDYSVSDRIGKIKRLDGTIEDITLAIRYGVHPRSHEVLKRPSYEKLITSVDEIDKYFPIAKGSAACISGRGASGRTSLLHNMAKNADVDIVVYVSASSRSKEIYELWDELSDEKDAKIGRALIERTVIISGMTNTSATAMEKTVHLGATVGEYYRNMGYSVLLIIDSINEWAKAIREKAFELDREFDLYPADIDAQISELLSRCGSVSDIGSDHRYGVLTTIVSADDVCDPVLQAVKRYVGTFCTLDSFAIDEDRSYSKYKEKPWCI